MLNTSCVLKSRLWEPREKAYLRNQCSSQYRDYPEVSVLLWRPGKSNKMSLLKKAFPGAEFVALWDGSSSGANYKEWRGKLNGANDFLVFTKREMGEVEAFERLVKVTNAHYSVYLNKDFSITEQSVAWLKSSYDRLRRAGGGSGCAQPWRRRRRRGRPASSLRSGPSPGTAAPRRRGLAAAMGRAPRSP